MSQYISIYLSIYINIHINIYQYISISILIQLNIYQYTSQYIAIRHDHVSFLLVSRCTSLVSSLLSFFLSTFGIGFTLSMKAKSRFLYSASWLLRRSFTTASLLFSLVRGLQDLKDATQRIRYM